MYHVSSKRHVIMIHHRSQVFVFKPGPWRADISLNTPHLSLKHQPHVQLSRKYLQSRPFLLQASSLVTVGSMTSHRMRGGRIGDPVLPCFVSSRFSCLLVLGPAHSTAATLSSGEVVIQTLIICHRHGDSDVALIPAFSS